MDQRMDMDEAVAGSGCFPRFSCPIATRRMMGLDPWMGWLYLRRGLSVFFSLPGWMSSTPRVLGGGMRGSLWGSWREEVKTTVVPHTWGWSF